MSNILEQKLTNLITPRPSDTSVNLKQNVDDFFNDNFCDLLPLLTSTENKDILQNNMNALYNFLKTPEIQSVSFQLPSYNYFQNLKSTAEIEEYLTKNDIKYPKTAFNGVKTAYTKAQEVALEIVRKRKKDLIDSLNIMIHKANDKETEEGSCHLYLGHFFLKGIFQKGTSDVMRINAPLLTTAVKVKIINNEKIVFEKRETTYNSRLFLFLEKSNLGNYPYIDKEVLDKYEVDLYDQLITKLKNLFNLNIADINVELEKFDIDLDYNFPQTLAFNDEEFTPTFKIQNNLALIFVEPTGGAIKKDVDKIKNMGKINAIFQEKLLDTEPDRIKKLVVSGQKKLLQLGRPLNFSQEVAATAATLTDSVIFGPPGTGKSETIATIIANTIKERKPNGENYNVLMVSSKPAALEVLEERLFKLSALMLPGFQIQNLDNFYKKIIDIKNSLQKEYKEIPLDYPTEIGDYIAKMEKISNILNKSVFLNGKEITIRQLNEAMGKIDPAVYEKMVSVNLTRAINVVIENLTEPPVINTLDQIFEKYANELTALEFLKITLSERLYNNIFATIWPKSEYREQLMSYLTSSDLNQDEVIYSSLLVALDRGEVSGKKNLELLNSYKSGNFELSNANKPLSKVKKSLIIIFSSKIDFVQLNNLFLISKFNKEDIENFRIIQFWLKNLGLNSIEDLKKLDINQITSEFFSKINSKEVNNDQNILNNYLWDLRKRYNELPDESPKKDDISKRSITNLFSVAQREYKLPINIFLRKYQKELLFLFPIWVLNPAQVSSALPCKPDIFELGIFDEASQMFLEQAYPILYRTKRKVVAGDDKQMKPIAYFMNVLQLSEEEKLMDENGDLAESLLDKAKTCGWETHFIENHYRSDKDSNIRFVNKWIYDNKLSIVPKNENLGASDINVIFLEDNFVEGKVNELEINKSVERILLTHIQNKKRIDDENKIITDWNTSNPDSPPKKLKPYDTISVICFNNFQQETLDKRIQDSAFIEKICSPDFEWGEFDERKKLLWPKKIPKKAFTNAEKKNEIKKIEAFLKTQKENGLEEKDVVDNLKNEIRVFVKWNINFDPLLEMIDEEKDYFELLCILKRVGVSQEMLNEAAHKESQEEDGSIQNQNQAPSFTLEDGLEVRDRYLKGEIVIKNLDNVQGSEADHVIIAMNTAPKQKENSRTLSFQKYKLTEENGRYALNVAITRAKKTTTIIKSFKIGDQKWELQSPGSENKDKQVFYEYVDFIEKFDKQERNLYTENSEIKDPIWLEVFNYIKSNLDPIAFDKLVFLENHRLGNFKVDFMIYDKIKQNFKILLMKNEVIQKNNMIENFDFNDKIKYLKDRGYPTAQIIPFFYHLNKDKLLKSILGATKTKS